MADAELIATVAVDGNIYSNWTSVRVTRIYATALSDFALTTAEPGNKGAGFQNLRIKPGQRCQVLLASVKVIDGYVTHRQVAYDGQQHAVMIQGKSLTRDIVRSSAKPSEFKGYKLEAIARGLTKDLPCKIVVKDPPPGWDKVLKVFRPHFGESIWSALERAGRFRGVQFHDDADGNLVISGAPMKSKGSGSRADLVEGENILSLRGVLSDENVFSKIQAVGQGTGSDNAFGKTVSEVSAKSENPLGAPGSFRIVLAEGPVDGIDAKMRADAETGTNAATDVDITVTVHGWLKPDGQLWDVRDPLTVQSPMMFPEAGGRMELGVRAVSFLQGPMGTVTELNLCLPNALSIVSQDVPKGEVPSILNSKGSAAAPETAA